MSLDPELQNSKQPRKHRPSEQRVKPEIRIWRTQPKLDLLESAIGQLVEREPQWMATAMATAKEARLDRLVKVLESFKDTAVKRQGELYGNRD